MLIIIKKINNNSNDNNNNNNKDCIQRDNSFDNVNLPRDLQIIIHVAYMSRSNIICYCFCLIYKNKECIRYQSAIVTVTTLWTVELKDEIK